MTRAYRELPVGIKIRRRWREHLDEQARRTLDVLFADDEQPVWAEVLPEHDWIDDDLAFMVRKPPHLFGP